MKKVFFLFAVEEKSFKNIRKKWILLIIEIFPTYSKKFLDFSKAVIDKYDDKVSLKELKQCIEKAYCQSN